MRIIPALATLTFTCALGPFMNAVAAPLPESNPFAKPSTLAYQLPPLDKIKNEHIAPGLEAGMAEELKEVEAIANNSAAPTFENTIVALERSGALLDRVSDVYSNLTASNTNPTLEQIQTDMAPKLAAHSDAIYLNEKLFARVKQLHEKRASLGLDPESLRLLERYYTLFVRAGANLTAEQKTKLKQINEQMSSLTTQFRQRVLKGDNATAIVVDKLEDLDGFSQTQIATAAEAAKSRGMEGKWVIPLLNTTQQPSLAQLKNRKLRERIFKASIGRGWSGEFATTDLIAQIVKLRAERAALLGYENHAAYVLEDATAQNARAVNDMLGKLAPPALANAKKEAAEIQQLIDAQAKASGTKSFTLEPWDWDFYAEQVRKAKFAYDESEVRPYFEMNRVLVDGVLFAAQELHGLKFKERKDLPTYHPDVRIFEVFNPDGSPLALFMVDWYARSNKRGGAWMNSFVEQSRLLNTKPVVINNLNIPKPPAGQPTLLTFDEVTTAFHEFGHALHGMFSDVQYPRFSGTSVPRDYVEFPSQYNEMWATDPRVLANYAKHHKTGEPMPKALMDKVLDSRKFNQGYATTEYLAAALLDQAYHQLAPGKTPSANEIAQFEANALEKAGIAYAAVPPRYRSTYFLHIFSSPIGYSSGYYAYIWSEVLARNTEHWFDTHGGLKRENGDVLREKILSRGFSMDAMKMFRDFYGKEPQIGPLLEARGLAGR